MSWLTQANKGRSRAICFDYLSLWVGKFPCFPSCSMLVCFSSGCWSLLCNIHLGMQLSALYLDSILPTFTLSSFLACSSFCCLDSYLLSSLFLFVVLCTFSLLYVYIYISLFIYFVFVFFHYIIFFLVLPICLSVYLSACLSFFLAYICVFPSFLLSFLLPFFGSVFSTSSCHWFTSLCALVFFFLHY